MPNRCDLHKYKRVKHGQNKNIVFKCINCPHYVTEPLVIGRDCECWYCGNSFKMNIHSLLLKPHCGCKNQKKIIQVSQGAAIENSNIISEIRAPKIKKIDPDLERAKSDIFDALLAKANR